MGRAPCCDKANVKRGPWSPDEDAVLKSFIDSHGTGGNWITLPKKAGLKRCGKSCRLRWLNYLRPDIKHGGFTDEENNIIFNLYNQVGSRWSVIASQLPGRTDNDIKNYWNTKLKKKFLSGSINPSISSSTNAMNYNINTPNSTAHANFSSFPESLDNIHYGSLNANSFSMKSEIGSKCLSQECSSITSSNSPNSVAPPMDNNNGLISLSGAQTSDLWFGFGWDKIIDELLSDDASIDQSFVDLNLLH